jgi:hypothetical protein
MKGISVPFVKLLRRVDNRMPLDVSKAPVSASPLWIIALFIALSEATAGAAAITTNGTSRLIFAYFAVAFPCIVFGVFVWLLIKHAPNLYAPGQYSKDITPEIYRVGIGRTDSIVLGRAVAESIVPLLGEGDEAKSREVAIQRVVRVFETAMEESSVIVNLDPLKPGADLVQIAVTEETKIQVLLNMLYFELDDVVEPGTYDVSWIMVDDDGNEYPNMGMHWAEGRGLDRDPRTISEVGILPGSRLTAIRKGRSRRPKRLG